MIISDNPYGRQLYISIDDGACPDGCVVLGIATACKPSLSTVLVLILAGECEKVNSDLGLGSGFHWVLQFPSSPTTG